MPPDFIASIIISVPTYNSMPHALFISMPQYEFNATKQFKFLTIFKKNRILYLHNTNLNG